MSPSWYINFNTYLRDPSAHHIYSGIWFFFFFLHLTKTGSLVVWLSKKIPVILRSRSQDNPHQPTSWNVNKSSTAEKAREIIQSISTHRFFAILNGSEAVWVTQAERMCTGNIYKRCMTPTGCISGKNDLRPGWTLPKGPGKYMRKRMRPKVQTNFDGSRSQNSSNPCLLKSNLESLCYFRWKTSEDMSSTWE